MSILKSIPKGRGYRRSLAFILDLVVCLGLITVLLRSFGESAQPVQIVTGFLVGAAFGWILRNAFSER